MTAPSQPIKAALWMMGAVVSFSSMAVAGREIAGTLDTFELMTYRSAIGVVIVLGVAFSRGLTHQIKTDRLGLHFLRNLMHFTGQNLWFFAVALIPFAQLFAFEFSVPLWVALAAPFFLSERLTGTRILSALVGFIGILIVARPGTAPISAGLIAAALCSLAFAATAIATKRLTRTQSTTCILFWLTLMQLGLGLIAAGWDLDIALPDAAALPWVIIVGLAGLFAHFCITTALQLAPAVIVTPMDFARLPLIAVVGMVFYGEALDIWVFVGAGLIFAANYVNILKETRSA